MWPATNGHLRLSHHIIQLTHQQVQDSAEADRVFSLDKSPLQVTPPRRPMERHKSESSGAKFPEFDLEKGKESSIKEETVLPPTLQHLVYFWEELALSVLKVRHMFMDR